MKPRLDICILDILRVKGELSAREILSVINDRQSCPLEVYHLCWSLTRLETQGLIRSRYERHLDPTQPNIKYYRSGDSV